MINAFFVNMAVLIVQLIQILFIKMRQYVQNVIMIMHSIQRIIIALIVVLLNNLVVSMDAKDVYITKNLKIMNA